MPTRLHEQTFRALITKKINNFISSFRLKYYPDTETFIYVEGVSEMLRQSLQAVKN